MIDYRNPLLTIKENEYTYLLYKRFDKRKKFQIFFEKFHLTYYLLKIEIEMNEFTKKKISKTMTGRKKSATHKKHISQSLKNRKLTDEHKENISKSMKLKYMDNQHRVTSK